jgi:uncharacterized membrane protein YhiD involved in acid resistance
MPQENAFMQTLTSQWARTPLSSFVAHLLLAALLGFVLGRVYVRFGTSLSNRDLFARNFVLLTMTTMLIITIVKSSLALSLGLVGALSIIRFRAAIKEPEELSYLFLAIAIGLGLGADQALITVAAFIAIAVILVAKRLVRKPGQRPNLYLTITAEGPQKIALSQLLATLQRHCTAARLKRFDETAATTEASFLASFDSVAKVEACTQQLRGLSEGVKVSYLDEKGIGV